MRKGLSCAARSSPRPLIATILCQSRINVVKSYSCLLKQILKSDSVTIPPDNIPFIIIGIFMELVRFYFKPILRRSAFSPIITTAPETVRTSNLYSPLVDQKTTATRPLTTVVNEQQIVPKIPLHKTSNADGMSLLEELIYGHNNNRTRNDSHYRSDFNGG